LFFSKTKTTRSSQPSIHSLLFLTGIGEGTPPRSRDGPEMRFTLAGTRPALTRRFTRHFSPLPSLLITHYPFSSSPSNHFFNNKLDIQTPDFCLNMCYHSTLSPLGLALPDRYKRSLILRDESFFNAVKSKHA
jgi:hypothetical protein